MALPSVHGLSSNLAKLSIKPEEVFPTGDEKTLPKKTSTSHAKIQDLDLIKDWVKGCNVTELIGGVGDLLNEILRRGITKDTVVASKSDDVRMVEKTSTQGKNDIEGKVIAWAAALTKRVVNVNANWKTIDFEYKKLCDKKYESEIYIQVDEVRENAVKTKNASKKRSRNEARLRRMEEAKRARLQEDIYVKASSDVSVPMNISASTKK